MQYLLFPLGNPGEKYESTRHNAGRIISLCLTKDISFKNYLKENEIEIFIPDCYMNESGSALKKYLKNKNFDLEKIIVLYDDKDLEIGTVRLSKDRGDGGHNGLKSIIENINTKDFYRIRIGIAPVGTGKNNLIPPHGEAVQKYVLGKFAKEEKDILLGDKVLDRIKLFLEEIIKKK